MKECERAALSGQKNNQVLRESEIQTEEELTHGLYAFKT